MSESMHIVCPHCDAVNRIPADRLQQSPRCGKCHEALFPARPVELGGDRFDKHLARNDIPLLARHFSGHFADEQQKSTLRFSPEAMRQLLDYDWPGNVRELENSIEHAIVISKGKYIEVSDLPIAVKHSETNTKTGSDRTIMENERKLLKEVLEECGWNKKEAAIRLGISRSTLYDKLKKYQITRPTVH